MKDFAVFIISYNRPNAQYTLKSLISCGYKGQYYIVLDDTDKSIQQYIDNYGTENIIVFDKNHYINTVETCMQNPYYATALYARAAVEDIAKDLGVKVYAIADDDITEFAMRYPDNDKLRRYSNFDIDKALNVIVEFTLSADATMVGIGYPSVFFRGISVFEPENLSNVITSLLPYNFIVRNTKHSVNWISAYGEDDITANNLCITGNKVLSVPFMQCAVVPNKNNASGGMSDTYKDNSFTLMFCIFKCHPTSVQIVDKKIGFGTRRLRGNICPKIISEKWRKQR